MALRKPRNRSRKSRRRFSLTAQLQPAAVPVSTISEQPMILRSKGLTCLCKRSDLSGVRSVREENQRFKSAGE